MGTFVTAQATPTVFPDGAKSAAPGLSVRSGWTSDNYLTAAEINSVHDALFDLRTSLRGLRFDVTHYGATSGGTAAANTTAFDAAVAAAKAAGGGIVYIPQGDFTVNEIVISDAASIHIIGLGTNATTVRFNSSGTTGRSVFKFVNCFRCSVRDMGIGGSTSAGVVNHSLVRFHTNIAVSISYGRSNNYCENVYAGGSNEYGVAAFRITAEDSGSNGNNDFNTFYRCQSDFGRLGAGALGQLSIEAHQSMGNMVLECKFLGGAYGITTASGPAWTGGSFLAWGCTFSGHTTADVFAKYGNGAHNVVAGGNSEGSDRLFISDGVANISGQTDIRSVRFACDALNADNKWIVLKHVGPTNIVACHYGAEATGVPQVHCDNGGSNNIAVNFFGNECLYAGSDATHPINWTGGTNSINCLGNVFADAGSVPTPKFDTFVGALRFDSAISSQVASGSNFLNALNGARLNLSTADSSAYLYRSAADTIRTPGSLTADATVTGLAVTATGTATAALARVGTGLAGISAPSTDDKIVAASTDNAANILLALDNASPQYASILAGDRSTRAAGVFRFYHPTPRWEIVAAGGGGSVLWKCDAVSGLVTQPYTDSTGSPGNAVINKPCGKSAVASGAQTCVVTNSCVSGTSNIQVTPLGVDTAAPLFKAVPAGGSFTVTTYNTSGVATNVGANWSFAWNVLNE